MPNFELVKPSIKYRDSFLAAVRELPVENHGQLIYIDWSLEKVEKEFDAYVSELLIRESKPPEPLVPDTIQWAVRGDEFLGRICFRHFLNDFLKNLGGHIGYAVRPSSRRQGVASEMLSRVLKSDRAKQLGQVMLTCRENNPESIHVITKNGGIQKGWFQDPEETARTLHFWIQTK